MTANQQSSASWAGIDITKFPALKAWQERMADRPAVKKGRNIPERVEVKNDPKSIAEAAEKAKAWVQSGMKADAEKYK